MALVSVHNVKFLLFYSYFSDEEVFCFARSHFLGPGNSLMGGLDFKPLKSGPIIGYQVPNGLPCLLNRSAFGAIKLPMGLIADVSIG